MATFTTSDGASLFYRLEGEGAPLLLLNGLFGDAAFWDPVAAFLREQRRCILLDHLGIDAAPVLGLCHGGMVGATMALSHPGRVGGLVCHGTRLLESAKTRVYDKFRRRLLDIGGVELMMSAQMGSLFGEASMVEVEPHVGKMSAGAIDRMDAASAGPMLDALIGFAMDPLDIARMSIPALFLAGEEDLYTPPWMVERTARLWPGARFQVLPNVAHIVPREAPADLARLTLQFLSDNGI